MKKLLVATILLISNACFSQLKAVIINSETKEKIPYVNIWVENENTGTTSNENGAFELHFDGRKTIVFSAIGFETKRISSNAIKNSLELKPFVTELDEIVINSKKTTKDLKTGRFKTYKIKYWTGVAGNTPTPRIDARFFEYKASYSKTPFLKTIKFLTDSPIEGSKFNIIFFDVNDNGEPYGYIYDKNLIRAAEKGRNITEIDISHLNIKFPKKGFFIAVEHLIIESNKYIYTAQHGRTRELFKEIRYAPEFGQVPSNPDKKSSWFFTQGTWKYILNNELRGFPEYIGKAPVLAIELTLTN